MSAQVISRAQAIVAALATLTVLAPLLVMAAAPPRTTDLWFHLAAGRSYATEGLWPAGDPLLHTAHEDAPVQHEWLFGVLVHGVERLAASHRQPPGHRPPQVTPTGAPRERRHLVGVDPSAVEVVAIDGGAQDVSDVVERHAEWPEQRGRPTLRRPAMHLD